MLFLIIYCLSWSPNTTCSPAVTISVIVLGWISKSVEIFVSPVTAQLIIWDLILVVPFSALVEADCPIINWAFTKTFCFYHEKKLLLNFLFTF